MTDNKQIFDSLATQIQQCLLTYGFKRTSQKTIAIECAPDRQALITALGVDLEYLASKDTGFAVVYNNLLVLHKLLENKWQLSMSIVENQVALVCPKDQSEPSVNKLIDYTNNLIQQVANSITDIYKQAPVPQPTASMPYSAQRNITFY